MQLRLAFLKKFGCRQVAIDIERDVSWTRRPSMQISSAFQWARRASLMDSSRKNMRRDSNTSNNSDPSNPMVLSNKSYDLCAFQYHGSHFTTLTQGRHC